jgi:hypothetical protein
VEDFWPEYGILSLAIAISSMPRTFTLGYAAHGFTFDNKERVFTQDVKDYVFKAR